LQPFPQTTGFLYYNRNQDAAPLEGSLRFRVTSANASSSFEPGHDLLLASGVPWQITLPQVASRKCYTEIRDQLLEENLVTAEEFTQCRALFQDNERTYPELTLFRLEQEFPVEFSGEICLIAVGHELHRFKCRTVFRLRTSSSEYHYPWDGCAIARFEPSTSPQYSGRRVVHLRIIKIVTPVSAKTPISATGESRVSLLKPKAGQLLSRSRPCYKGPKPWAYDIDASDSAFAAALRVLWDNSRIGKKTRSV
ncbi:hypothetical protein B0H14DRAFT_2498314, partial [Mycena olivaceomarginata]